MAESTGRRPINKRQASSEKAGSVGVGEQGEGKGSFCAAKASSVVPRTRSVVTSVLRAVALLVKLGLAGLTAGWLLF